MTKLSRKQANVIYSNVKQGKLEMDKTDVSVMYSIAKDCSIGHYQTAATFHELVLMIREMLDAIFSNDVKKAQEIYDNRLY